jgi:hypothetical protein
MHSFFRPVFGSKPVQTRSSPKAVTPFGGLVSLFELFNRIGLPSKLAQTMPLTLRSPKGQPPQSVHRSRTDFRLPRYGQALRSWIFWRVFSRLAAAVLARFLACFVVSAGAQPVPGSQLRVLVYG